MQSTSDVEIVAPRLIAEDVWVKFLIRHHRAEATLRERFVRLTEVFSGSARSKRQSQEEFWALRGLSVEGKPGDVVGVIGRNGSGKTTLLKVLAGIIGPDRGHVAIEGTVGCLLSFGVGFRTNLSGRENVYINGSVLGLKRSEIAERLDSIIEFAELGEFIDAPVRTYSSGMRGRLGFSIAINIDPQILILDEVMTTGDMGFQQKAGTVLDRLRDDQRIILVASHSMEFVRRSCTRAIWLERGEIRLSGSPEEVTEAYRQFFKKPVESPPRIERGN